MELLAPGLLGMPFPYEAFDLTDSTFLTRAASTADYVFTTRATGAAHPRRWVIVAFTMESTSSISGLTSVVIGGVTATQLYTINFSQFRVAFYAALVPTGTTATITIDIDASGTSRGCGIAIFRAIRRDGTAPTAFNSNTASVSSGNATLSTTVNCPGGGVLLACVQCANGGTGYTWTGATEVAEIDLNSDEWFSCAVVPFTPTQTGRTVQAVAGTTPANGHLLGVVTLN